MSNALALQYDQAICKQYWIKNMTEPTYITKEDIESSESVKKILHSSPPPVLYHYTTRAGLIGMLEQRAVYASDVRYLNDENEIALAIRLTQEIIFARLSHPDDDESLYEKIKSWLYSLESQIRVFVFSMTEEGDLLSQWRAYCKPNDGYAIGIDPQKLLKHANTQSTFFLARCEYDKNNQTTILSNLIDEVKAVYQKRRKGNGMSLNDSLNATMMHFILWFLVVAPTMKDTAFEAEKEWRLISWLSFGSLGDGNVFYRDGRSLLMPYVKVKLASEGDQLPIIEAIVGPSSHKDIEVSAVQAFLVKSNATGHAVNLSKVPYRGSHSY
jgi:hypothetical protein